MHPVCLAQCSFRLREDYLNLDRQFIKSLQNERDFWKRVTISLKKMVKVAKDPESRISPQRALKQKDQLIVVDWFIWNYRQKFVSQHQQNLENLVLRRTEIRSHLSDEDIRGIEEVIGENQKLYGKLHDSLEALFESVSVLSAQVRQECDRMIGF